MSQLEQQDDEIDLLELFHVLWHNWATIVSTVLISTFAATYYVSFVAVPEYEASTRFELLSGNSGPSLGEFSSLARLAGISEPGGASEAETLEDRVLSRPFVEKIYQSAGFSADPLFNTWIAEPSISSRLIAAFWGSSDRQEPSIEEYHAIAVNALKDRMNITVARNEIIELSVTHPDPQRSAELSNIIAAQAIEDIFNRRRAELEESVAYFAVELTKAREQLDAANAAVRDYALRNSLQSPEVLAQTSIQLAQLRNDLNDLEQSIVALQALNEIPSENFDGVSFSLTYPIANSVSFRRLLNFSSLPNMWRRPADDIIQSAIARLSQQRTARQASLTSLEAEARISGNEALELAALEREVEVQQAIYEAVITQFEAQERFSGFEQSPERIIETAIPPKDPSKPRKIIFMGLATVVGGFMGVMVALLVKFKRGTIFTFNAISTYFAINNKMMFSHSLMSKTLGERLSPRQNSAYQDVIASLKFENKAAVVISSSRKINVLNFAFNLCENIVRMGETAALLVLVNDKSFIKNQPTQDKAGLSKYPEIQNVDFFKSEYPQSFLKRENAQNAFNYLTKNYDKVIIACPIPEDGIAVTQIFASLSKSSIILAERAKTTQTTVETINSTLAKSNITDPLLVMT